MAILYQKSKGLQDTELHYCPAYSWIIHKLIAEVLEEMGLLDTTIAVCPVGCAVFAAITFPLTPSKPLMAELLPVATRCEENPP